MKPPFARFDLIQRTVLSAAAAVLVPGMMVAAAAEKPASSEANSVQTPPQPPVRPPELATDGSSPAPPSSAPAPPVPPGRPPELSAAPAPAPAASEAAAPAAIVSAPPPPQRPAELSGAGALRLTVTPPDDTACLRRLERLGVRFERMEPIVNGQCSLARPLNVIALADGIALEPNDTMVCGIAEALARWTTEVQVVAQKELGDRLTSLKLGGTYVCRGQNNGGEAKLSEHAFANAVDIMGFTFEKHPPIMIQARPPGTPDAAFQTSVWTTACRFFRTVLGPGSDASHDTHLHLDERERPGRQRLCE